MKTLIAGIMAKTTGSALSTAVGGRIYRKDAPARTTYPYVVFNLPITGQQDTFSHDIDDSTLQFDIYHNSASGSAMATIHDLLRTLFDDAVLAVTGYTNVMTVYQNTVQQSTEVTTPGGAEIVEHWAVNYEVILQTV